MSKPFLGSFGVKLLLFLNSIMIEVKADSRLLLIFCFLISVTWSPAEILTIQMVNFKLFFQEKVKFLNFKNKKINMMSDDRQNKIAAYLFWGLLIYKISDIFVIISAHANWKTFSCETYALRILRWLWGKIFFFQNSPFSGEYPTFKFWI